MDVYSTTHIHTHLLIHKQIKYNTENACMRTITYSFVPAGARAVTPKNAHSHTKM